MFFGNGSQNEDFIFNGLNLTNSCGEKMFGVISDNEFKFEPPLRIAKADIVFLGPEKKAYNAVIKSYLSYCLLTWIFSCPKFDKLIKRFHQKPLRTM